MEEQSTNVRIKKGTGGQELFWKELSESRSNGMEIGTI